MRFPLSSRPFRGLVAATLLSRLSEISVSDVAWGQEATSTSSKYKPADVQTEASRVYVFVDKVGLGHQHGVEAKLAASTLVLGASENAGTLVFDMTSFDADTDAARRYVGLSGSTDRGTRQAVNENMKGSAVLNVGRYPTATFKVDSALATGRSNDNGIPIYELKGNFTLHGTTRPLSVNAEVSQARGWLHAKGSFMINQTDYGIRPYSKAFGAIGVTNSLKIYGDLFIAPTEKVALSDFPVRQ